MDYTHILVRHGELFLKGKNQLFFEKKLIENLRKITGITTLQRGRGRSLMPYFENYNLLKYVFGIVSYSPCLRTEKNLKEIQKAALSFLQKYQGTFKIETKRSDKQFPLPSLEVSREVGMFLEENTLATVSLTNPELILTIEINQVGVFLFTEIILGPGGLPVRTGGKVLLFLRDEASILAGLLLMKRGCPLELVSLQETSSFALLQQFSPTPLKIQKFSSVHKIEEYALNQGIPYIVVGDCFENDFTKGLFPALTVLKPLIAYNQQLIQRELLFFTSPPILHNSQEHPARKQL